MRAFKKTVTVTMATTEIKERLDIVEKINNEKFKLRNDCKTTEIKERLDIVEKINNEKFKLRNDCNYNHFVV